MGLDIGNGWSLLGCHSYWEWGEALRLDTDIGTGTEPLGLTQILGMGGALRLGTYMPASTVQWQHKKDEKSLHTQCSVCLMLS